MLISAGYQKEENCKSKQYVTKNMRKQIHTKQNRIVFFLIIVYHYKGKNHRKMC